MGPFFDALQKDLQNLLDKSQDPDEIKSIMRKKSMMETALKNTTPIKNLVNRLKIHLRSFHEMDKCPFLFAIEDIKTGDIVAVDTILRKVRALKEDELLSDDRLMGVLWQTEQELKNSGKYQYFCDEYWHKIHADEDTRATTEEVYSFALIDIVEKVVVLHIGLGGNAKSIHQDNMLKIFKDYATKGAESLLGKKTDSTSLVNSITSRLTIVDEVSQDLEFGDATIKGMSGSEFMGGRVIYDKKTQHKNTTSLHVSLNQIPRINIMDKALTDRLVIIPWTSLFVDPKDPSKPETNASKHIYARDDYFKSDSFWKKYGIVFVWILLRAQQRVREKGITISAGCRKFKSEVLAQCIGAAVDPFVSFIDDFYVMDSKQNAWCKEIAELYVESKYHNQNMTVNEAEKYVRSKVRELGQFVYIKRKMINKKTLRGWLKGYKRNSQSVEDMKHCDNESEDEDNDEDIELAMSHLSHHAADLTLQENDTQNRIIDVEPKAYDSEFNNKYNKNFYSQNDVYSKDELDIKSPNGNTLKRKLLPRSGRSMRRRLSQ